MLIHVPITEPQGYVIDQFCQAKRFRLQEPVRRAPRDDASVMNLCDSSTSGKSAELVRVPSHLVQIPKLQSSGFDAHRQVSSIRADGQRQCANHDD